MSLMSGEPIIPRTAVSGGGMPEPEPELTCPIDQYDRYGLVLGCEHAVVYTNEASEGEKEEERQQKWDKMVLSWADYAGASATRRRAAKLKRRVRKGIPVTHRGQVWFLMSGGYSAMESHPGEYQDLAFTQSCPAKVEQQIRLDIGRTITDHAYFRDLASAGQEALYRVLRAYAVHNRKVAYCQGMSYVAGMFLCQGVNEEQAFWMFRQFMHAEKYNLCGLYEDGFPLMQRYLDNLTELLQRDYSEVYKHVCEKHGVVPLMFAEKWLLTLFMYNWPYKIALRIWDVVVHEGPAAFFAFALSVPPPTPSPSFRAP